MTVSVRRVRAAAGLLAAAVGALAVVLVDSETAYTWRLDADVGKVMPAGAAGAAGAAGRQRDAAAADMHETVLDILMSTVTQGDGSWRKTYCASCDRNRYAYDDADSEPDSDSALDCGRPVNFTYYDHLMGIANRALHPRVPEPDVATSFFGRMSASTATVESIERRLRRAKRDEPRSVDLYQQIGNLLRLKGETGLAIECFRRALAVTPHSAEVLLNLARVLFRLQYLDDAIFLTRRSLEVQPPELNAWQQHFQLGEILKAYCHHQEAALHLRHVLELKPNYAPALAALSEMESAPDATLHSYTIVIIVLLVVAVLVWIVSTLEVGVADGGGGVSDAGGGGSRPARLSRLHARHKYIGRAI